MQRWVDERGWSWWTSPRWTSPAPALQLSPSPPDGAAREGYRLIGTLVPHDPVLLSRLGWDPSWQSAHDGAVGALPAHDSISSRPARVMRADRGACTLVSDTGEQRAAYAPGLDPVPCAGDWVAWNPATGLVVAVLPRRGALRRADTAPGSSREQVLACNVDIVIVAEPVWPEADLGRVERLVTLSWDGGATPVVVLTKCDLLPAEDGLLARAEATAPGCQVLRASATTGVGLEPLSRLLGPGVTAALLGPSGAGKSTLVNALTGRDIAPTGEVRRDGKGRHTTVHRELVVMDSGACLLDTPGLRSVGLVGSAGAPDGGGLALAFPEVDALLGQCRFADCGHDTEPSCAVTAALDAGELDPRRWASWRRLVREAEWMASRTDLRLAAEQRDRRKAIQREARQRGHR